MNFSWTTRWWAFRICLSKKLLTCTAGCIIMVRLSCWLAILALQGGYLLFQNAVYLSQKKRTIRPHACTLSTYTKAWQDVTVKWEFVCNFAGGYADINPLSNLKAIIWTIKHQQFWTTSLSPGDKWNVLEKSALFTHPLEAWEKDRWFNVLPSYQVYNAKMQNNNFLIKRYPVFG